MSSPQPRTYLRKSKNIFYKLEDENGNSLNSNTNASILLTFSCYAISMFVVPVAVFFVLRHYLTTSWEVTPPWNNLYPAIASILVVNCIIVAYVIKAFKEEKVAFEAEKQQKLKSQ